MTLRLVVNADDLGMSAVVNAAIADALEAGHVRSATVLANGPAIDDALRLARAFPRASFGVHLNLTEFAPLTGGLARVLGPDGTFGPESLRLGPRDADAVLDEWSAQVDRVASAGVPISHLDSHQHLHHRPALFPVLAAVRARFHIARVRGMGAWRLPAPGLHARLGALRQRLRARRFHDRLRASGAVTTDGFASVSVFHAHARRGPLPCATFEVMAHPGNPHGARYAEELALLRDGALAALPFPVAQVTWHDI